MLRQASGSDVARNFFAGLKHSIAINIQGCLIEASSSGRLEHTGTGSKILHIIERETAKAIATAFRRQDDLEPFWAAEDNRIFDFYVRDDVVEIVRVANALRGDPDDITQEQIACMQSRLADLAVQMRRDRRQPRGRWRDLIGRRIK